MSSRELLKRAVTLIKCLNGASWEHEVPQVVIQDIETYLAQPEPEPVAWAIFRKGTMYDFSKTRPGEELLGQMGDYAIPVYTTPPDQSARIAELEKDNNITHENLAWYMEKYHEHLTIIAEAAHGLGINHE